MVETIRFLLGLLLALTAWSCTDSGASDDNENASSDADADSDGDGDGDDDEDTSPVYENCPGHCVTTLNGCDPGEQVTFDTAIQCANTNEYCCVTADGTDTDTGDTDLPDCVATCVQLDLDNEANYYCPSGTSMVLGSCTGDFDVCCTAGASGSGCPGTCFPMELNNEANFFCPTGTGRVILGTCTDNFDVCCTAGGTIDTDPQDNCPGQCRPACQGEWVPATGTCDASGGICCRMSQDTAETDCPSGSTCMGAVDCVLAGGTAGGNCGGGQTCCVL